MERPDLQPIGILPHYVTSYYKRYLPSAYDPSMSIYEQLVTVIEHLNQQGKIVGEIARQWNELCKWIMNDGLNEAVRKQLQKWIDDGTLGKIINEEVFGEIGNRISSLHKINVYDEGIKPSVEDNKTLMEALSAKVNAMTDSNIDIEIFFPEGVYTYSGGLKFTREVKLTGFGTLNFTGNGYAVDFGKETGSVSDYQRIYAVDGLTFTGGAMMAQGINFRNFVTMPRLNNVKFINFGNKDAFGVHFAGNNWDAYMSDCTYYSRLEYKTNWIKAYHNKINSTRVRITNCVGTNQSEIRGIGIWLDGANNIIGDCKLEGFAPNIRLGGLANYCTIHDTYFESLDAGGNIQFGDESGGQYESNWINGLTISNCYANMHNTDGLGGTSYFLEPTNDKVGLQDTVLENIHVRASNKEMVRLNPLVSQVRNRANSCTNNSNKPIHTMGTGVTQWSGNNSFLESRSAFDLPSYWTFRTGTTATQYQGFRFLDKDGTEMTIIDVAPNGYVNFKLFNKLALQVDSQGNTKSLELSKAKGFQITEAKGTALSSKGELFEDSDGKLKYRKLDNTVIELG